MKGFIYCVIAPFIMVFNVLTFGLFWFVYRYNTLYVTKFRFDTGGLLFPKAINQLFTGIYVMELCLIGLFFLVRDTNNQVACQGQAICMIVVLILTTGYQLFLNEAFSPLIRYLPITLEDEAVRRDEEFARCQRARLGLPVDEDDDVTHETALAVGEQPGANGGTKAGEIDPGKIKAKEEWESQQGHFYSVKRIALGNVQKLVGGRRKSWADRPQNRRSKYFGANSAGGEPSIQQMREKLAQDEEAQTATKTIGHALFAGIHDELEDLTPDERDQLVQRAFQHEALRAKRPVIWIPRDDLGVSDDEVYRTQRFSKHIWISNEYQALDGKCRPIFCRSPPDFSEVDLIQL
jgi:calcium permeable stress-gated cation channel